MKILHYLAMTGAEIQGKPLLPGKIAWLSCHFSPGGRGLSNRPTGLPPGQMLILDDALPMENHLPDRVVEQLTQWVEENRCEALLLDFQRPPTSHTLALAKRIAGELRCPVGVAKDYADGLDCPVFLPPVPPDTLPEVYLAPWNGREIWLDGAKNGEVITVTEKGAIAAPLTDDSLRNGDFSEPELCCHYRVEVEKGIARFTLFRTAEDVAALIRRCEPLGVTKAVSLWQEMTVQE